MYNFYPFQGGMLQTQPQVQPTQIPYVNGKQSAEAYQMGPNSSVILMDSNSPRFYLKQTDASGIVTLKAYDFKEAEDEKPPEYVTKQEFEKFKATMKGGKHEPTNDAPRKQ